MKLREVLPVLEQLAPLAYAEDFDNVGLLVGHPDQIISGILICHDALETVIEEAISKKCNLVVCFHPIIFSGMKKITGKNYVERAVVKAIKNDVAIYAIHTALDNHRNGVNRILCDVLGLVNTRILLPKEQYIYKLTTYVPKKDSTRLKQALYEAGAGSIGNYDHCSFTSKGKGSFRGNAGSQPVIGTAGEDTLVNEHKIEITFEKQLQPAVLKALYDTHPYEEVAYEIIRLENKHQNIGMGMIGSLPEAMEGSDFLQMVKEKVQTGGIRYSRMVPQKIKRVAVLGGSGSFAIQAAKAQGADALVTSDLKYHDFYQAEDALILADVGHFESERYVKNYIFDYLTKKITTFAIILSQTNTNPVNYL